MLPAIADVLQFVVSHVGNGKEKKVFVGVYTFPQLKARKIGR